MSQQPQSWGIGAETYAKTSVKVIESVTPNLNLCSSQNKVASKIVPVVILELVGPITKGPIIQDILRVAWFSPCQGFCIVSLSTMALDVCPGWPTPSESGSTHNLIFPFLVRSSWSSARKFKEAQWSDVKWAQVSTWEISEGMEAWGSKCIEGNVSLCQESSTDTCPYKRRVMSALTEGSPLGSAETSLCTGWQYLAEGASVLLWFSTEVISAGRSVSRLRDYDDHDEVICGELNLLVCLVPSTLDWLLTSSGQRGSLGSIMRPHSLVWARPIHTCAAYSFFPGNLEPNGVISQWPEMTLFPRCVDYFFYSISS